MLKVFALQAVPGSHRYDAVMIISTYAYFDYPMVYILTAGTCGARRECSPLLIESFIQERPSSPVRVQRRPVGSLSENVVSN